MRLTEREVCALFRTWFLDETRLVVLFESSNGFGGFLTGRVAKPPDKTLRLADAERDVDFTCSVESSTWDFVDSRDASRLLPRFKRSRERIERAIEGRNGSGRVVFIEFSSD